MTRIVINPSELRTLARALQETAREREQMRATLQHASLPEMPAEIAGEVRSTLRRCAHRCDVHVHFLERERRDLIRRAERMEADLATPSPSYLSPWQRQAFLLRRSPASLPPWLRGRSEGRQRLLRLDSDRDGIPDWCDPPTWYGVERNVRATDDLDFLFGPLGIVKSGVRRAGGSVLGRLGRQGKQARLRELARDPKVSSAYRGWIRQELNQIERGKRTTIRLPGSARREPGPMVLAHRRGYEAARGYSYHHADLQYRDLHRLQHQWEGYSGKWSVRRHGGY